MIFCVILMLLSIGLFCAAAYVSSCSKYEDKNIIAIVLVIVGILILIGCYYNFENIINDSTITF